MALSHWFPVRKELSQGKRTVIGICSFFLPLGLWCAISYLPFLWHPKMEVTDKGEVAFLKVGDLVDRQDFSAYNRQALEDGRKPAVGIPSNPIYLPAPHEVVSAFFRGLFLPPPREGDPWVYQSLLHSIQIIAYGFIFSSLVGVPLGILCGTFSFFSRLLEPFVEFFRYLPAPAFGALAVAILGINDAPKVAIIIIGTLPQQLLVIANTTRKLEMSLLEAAQTLGANPFQLVTRVVIPGIMPDVYRNQRILLGWAWTYLIIAEIVGAYSGISEFIYRQAKYRVFENVYAAIIMIGIIGFSSDRLLGWLENQLFPWRTGKHSRFFILMRRLFGPRNEMLFPPKKNEEGRHA